MFIDKEWLINEYGMDIAIKKISQINTELIKQYMQTNDESLLEQIINLLQDRDKIYNNDINTIKKYCRK